MTEATEEWRPVVGYEGYYEVSDWGRVRSVTRWVLGRAGKYRLWRGRLLTLQLNPARGGCYQLRISKLGVPNTVKVHQLVMAAFVGPCPQGQEVLHWNDVATDNRLSNLRYGTRSDNLRDRYRNERLRGTANAA